MRGVARRLDVFVDRGGRIDVVDDDIQPAVVVQVRERRAVGESRIVQSPIASAIGECEIAVVAEQVIRDAQAGQVPNGLQLPGTCPRAFLAAQPEHLGLIVVIGHRFGVAVRDEEVLEPVIVDIAEQGTPAPVGVRHAGEARDLAECHDAARSHAAVQLQRILRVAALKPVLAAIEIRAARHDAARSFSPREVLRHHVGLDNVGPAVVVEVRGVDAHPGEARVPQPLA